MKTDVRSAHTGQGIRAYPESRVGRICCWRDTWCERSRNMENGYKDLGSIWGCCGVTHGGLAPAAMGLRELPYTVSVARDEKRSEGCLTRI